MNDYCVIKNYLIGDLNYCFEIDGYWFPKFIGNANLKQIREKALEIKSDKADKVGYEAAQLLYTTADEYTELKDYENSFNYYVKALDAFDDVYNNVSAKRQAALDAIERAKHKADNVDEFAAEADKIAPLSTEGDNQGEE